MKTKAAPAAKKKPAPPARGRLRSMKVSDSFRAFVLDQLDGVDGLRARAMFGGVGLYCRGVFFGIIARDELYLKADDTNRPDYEAAGMHPFMPYPGRAGKKKRKYYAVPMDVLENTFELAAWARKAVAAARRSRP